MMPSNQVTYTDPKITRNSVEALIQFDIITPTYRAWESIRIERREDGSIQIDGRDDGPLSIPAPVLPVVLAEIDRLVTRDDEPPAPVIAIDVAQQATFGGDAA